MTNDLSTLSGALLEMKDQLISELDGKGVTASYSNSTGLLGLISKINEIEQGGNGNLLFYDGGVTNNTNANYIISGNTPTVTVSSNGTSMVVSSGTTYRIANKEIKGDFVLEYTAVDTDRSGVSLLKYENNSWTVKKTIFAEPSSGLRIDEPGTTTKSFPFTRNYPSKIKIIRLGSSIYVYFNEIFITSQNVTTDNIYVGWRIATYEYTVKDFAISPISSTSMPQLTISLKNEDVKVGDNILIEATLKSTTPGINTSYGVMENGKVRFYDNNILLGESTTGLDGKAPFIIRNLSGGTHTIKALFEGKELNEQHYSNELTLQIPTYDLSFSQSSYTASNGKTTMEVTLTDNSVAVEGEKIRLDGSDGSYYYAITDSLGVATFEVDQSNGSRLGFTASYKQSKAQCSVSGTLSVLTTIKITYDSSIESTFVTGVSSGSMFTYTGTVTIDWGDGSSVETYDGSTFSHTYANDGMYIVNIKGNITGLSQKAFRNSSGIIFVLLSPNITTIDSYAFYNCINLRNVRLTESLTTNINKSYGFAYCENLEEITIPSSVSRLGTYWFYHCTNLKKITFLNEDVTLDDRIFQECINLEEVIFKGKFSFFNSRQFYNCSNLKKIKGEMYNPLNISNSYTFYGCSQLESIEVANDVMYSQYIFYGCEKLKEIIVPEAMSGLSNNTFSNCKNLTSIVLPNSITSIGYSCFSGCNKLKTVNIPDSVTSIENDTFSDCISLNNIVLPNSITQMKNSVFRGCISLKSITLPQSLTSIGDYCFRQCFNMKNITIPSNVTSIGTYCFMNCTGLESITFTSQIPPTASNYAFGTIPTTCVIYVPSESLSNYTNATNYPNSSTYTYIGY